MIKAERIAAELVGGPCDGESCEMWLCQRCGNYHAIGPDDDRIQTGYYQQRDDGAPPDVLYWHEGLDGY